MHRGRNMFMFSEQHIQVFHPPTISGRLHFIPDSITPNLPKTSGLTPLPEAQKAIVIIIPHPWPLIAT